MVLKLEDGFDQNRPATDVKLKPYDAAYLGARAFNRAYATFEADAGVTTGDVVLQGANGNPDDATWHDIATLNAAAPVAEQAIAYAWVRLSVDSYAGAGDIRATLILRND